MEGLSTAALSPAASSFAAFSASYSTFGSPSIEVTKESLSGEVLDYDIETAQFFFEIGMHCLGCPASRGESIADACAVHGTDADELIEKINAFLASKNN